MANTDSSVIPLALSPDTTRRASYDVPNELWLHIFHLATFVQGSLDAEHHDSFDHEADLWNTALQYSTIPRFPLIKASNATKLGFALVCKRWHGLAIPLLYRTVHVNKCDDLRSLGHTLQQSAKSAADASAEGHNPPLGSWVLRLDLAMDDLPKTASGMTSVLENLTAIFISLPKLEILSVNALPPLHLAATDASRPLSLCLAHISEPTWDALTSSCGGSLLRLQFTANLYNSCILPPLPSGQGGMLTGFTRLRTLGPGFDGECPVCNELPSTLTSYIRPLHGRNTHECSLVRGLPHPQCPRLSTISLTIRRSHPSLCSQRFLALNGLPVTTILIFSSRSAVKYRLTLELIRQYCPNLTRLILVVTTLDQTDNASDIIRLMPPSVTHLGVALDLPHWYRDPSSTEAIDESDLGRIVEWLSEARLALSSSAVRLVRFFHSKYYERPSRSGETQVLGLDTELGEALKRFEGCRVPLEGFNGQLLRCATE
ncbi:uncharacterized protein STEHIDRAFT_171371 [Stereum hirsutum FP-91666 SS1]|uniref:uncharacterized protein n=1 Tax=Stereum hirsutum (strain FP-91666) TaxID=721885 RepID=UPI0004449821|nr:uncharacterized protein STEHIDRAFT_171371 [Stereum hirsutum FP-91666 SS1]EIM82462.1 hypothetical protein STEHIDRAFT_171371 [Stereum hirsutum FP-91666 SS1]